MAFRNFSSRQLPGMPRPTIAGSRGDLGGNLVTRPVAHTVRPFVRHLLERPTVLERNNNAPSACLVDLDVPFPLGLFRG
jgi:hypothetical protein